MFIFLIKEIREQKGMTQEELAKKTGISRNYITELENNKKENPSLKTMHKIAIALNKKITDIYVANSDTEELKKLMYKSIEETGINSKETLKISRIINKLIMMDMEEKGNF